MIELVDQIEANLDDLFKYEPDPLDAPELQKQRAHVAHSLERCRRCGDHIAYLTPVGMSTFCDPCSEHLHGLDDLEHPGLKWFQEMVTTIANQQRNRAHGQLICGCGAPAITRRHGFPVCGTCDDGLAQAERKGSKV